MSKGSAISPEAFSNCCTMTGHDALAYGAVGSGLDMPGRQVGSCGGGPRGGQRASTSARAACSAAAEARLTESSMQGGLRSISARAASSETCAFRSRPSVSLRQDEELLIEASFAQ